MNGLNGFKKTFVDTLMSSNHAITFKYFPNAQIYWIIVEQ